MTGPHNQQVRAEGFRKGVQTVGGEGVDGGWSEVSRCCCFYGGAFPLLLRGSRCPGTFPRAVSVDGISEEVRLFGSSYCDSLSEGWKKKREDVRFRI